MKRISYILTAAFLAIAMIGCGSDSNGGNNGNAPSIPTSSLENSQPDISYFQGTPKTSSQDALSDNYNSARNTVLGFGSIGQIGTIYFPFFQQAQSSNASFSNGVWEWEYNFSSQGSSVSFRLTAREVSNGIEWDMFYSASTQGGSFDNYNVISGFVNSDGTMGEWTFNALTEPGTEIPLLRSVWEAVNDSDRDIDLTIFDDQGQTDETITYDQNGTIHTMNIGSNITVYWDTSADQGYIEIGDAQRMCWSNGQDVDCASIGL